ncbi:MAG TPA: LCP family protein [Patescibacteria group bacterium]|nr:LCP family protein [Patescibacteria group bacterium]
MPKKKKRVTSEPHLPAKAHPVDHVLFHTLRIITTLLAGVAAVIIGGVLLISLIIGGVSAYYVQKVSNGANLPFPRLVQTVLSGREAQVKQTAGRTNILLLGLDKLSNRDENTILTDTIMVVSVNSNSGSVTTFSFPRDLYLVQDKTKINALYQLGGAKLIKDSVEQISGLPIHYVIPIDIEAVGKMIDALGGIDVHVERSFTDTQFPRTDVDVRVVKDPKLLYETVTFVQGTEHMSGTRALQYMRSRHSSDPIEGTDDARVHRQQLVLEALLSSLKNPTNVRYPERMGNLLRFYLENIDGYFPFGEAENLGLQFAKKGVFPSLTTHQFMIQTKYSSGVFVHPDRFAGGAWVYLPVDPTWKTIQKQVGDWFK